MEGETLAAGPSSTLEDVPVGQDDTDAASFQMDDWARMRDLLNGDRGNNEVSGESSKNTSEIGRTPVGLFEESSRHLSPRTSSSILYDYTEWLKSIPTKYPSLATEPPDLSAELDKIRNDWSTYSPDILRHGMHRLNDLNRHPTIRILRITDLFTLDKPEELKREDRWSEWREKDNRLTRCGMFLQLDALWLDPSYAILPFNVLAMVFPVLNIPDSKWTGPYDFFAQHATPWPTNETRMMADRSFEWVYLHIHFRSFVSGIKLRKPKPERSEPVLSGIKLEREYASLECVDGSKIPISERRYSLAVHLNPVAADSPGHFYILAFVDFCSQRLDPAYNVNSIYDLDKFGFKPCRMFAGIVSFQCVTYITIQQWFSDWFNTILALEESLQFKLGDILNKHSAERYMYDNEELDRSRFYFSFLQLLRISSERITRSMADLKSVAEQCDEQLSGRFSSGSCIDRASESDFEAAARIVTQNWDVVLSFHQKEGHELLDRINQNVKAVESLRDGLFNAQSVREALRGTEINQYLLVFTVVTIIFLPPSFIATFYGMHLFDGDGDIIQTQKNFWITFVTVAVATYIAAVIGLSGVKRRRKLKGWFDGKAKVIKDIFYKKVENTNRLKKTVGSNRTAAASGVRGGEKGEAGANRSNIFISLPRFRHPRTSRDPERADKGKMPERVNIGVIEAAQGS
ncbi:hypothetical protein F4776DRAFT_632423 [Hypoxylon sp. NC0597]|nr:hypothetical protein F4776DRAFT_632423 [Hypoxylon sp. NC0597]